MRTSDGIDVDWPYSDVPLVSLSAEQIRALREGQAWERAVAHARLTSGQFAKLYRGRLSYVQIGRRYRQVGRRILAFRLEAYCEGIGAKKLQKLLARPTTREALILKLLNG